MTDSRQHRIRISAMLLALGGVIGSAGYWIGRTTEPPKPAVHLNRDAHWTRMLQDPRVSARLERFPSDFDGRPQTWLQIEPAEGKPERLFIFFHGMDGDAGDAAVVYALAARHRAVIVAPAGRGPAWLSDAFLKDAEQVVREAGRRTGLTEIYLAGISMGGTQALSLCGLLPDDLRDRLSGVLAIIPTADMQRAQRDSSVPRVRQTLADCPHLGPRSALQLVDRFPSDLPVCVLYRDRDTVLPHESVLRFAQEWRQRGGPVLALPLPGEHAFGFDELDEAPWVAFLTAHRRRP